MAKQLRVGNLFQILSGLAFFFVTACTNSASNPIKGEALFNRHCASCHQAPKINQLPKFIWQQQVLPDMAARMGIRENNFNPFKGLTLEEAELVAQSNVYPLKPTISFKDWQILKRYIINQAPDTLPKITTHRIDSLNLFNRLSYTIDRDKTPNYTYLKWQENKFTLANIYGDFLDFYPNTQETLFKQKFKSPIIAHTQLDSLELYTVIGKLDPSEKATGYSYLNGIELPYKLHRPVYQNLADLNNDNEPEILINEFGHHTGRLSLFSKNESKNTYIQKTIWPYAGVIKTQLKDLNNDGLLDIIALTTQGNESIMIFIQKEHLNFEPRKVLSFSPVYGSSWFEMIDMNKDGHLDIVTVHGDNADLSYTPKPYHGLRIFINDGDLNFTEKYFYPMYGATRFLAHDYDEDNDIDLAIISTFPDYTNAQSLPFIYLENIGDIDFKPKSFPDVHLGRWFLMDDGDFDHDGDIDIALSSFTYNFTPVPKKNRSLWHEKNIHLLILENKLIE